MTSSVAKKILMGAVQRKSDPCHGCHTPLPAELLRMLA
jgi:hypothetical protein